MLSVGQESSGELEGPFTCAFWFRLGFPLKSKSNFRRSPSAGSWSSHRAFEQSLGALARSVRPAGWVVPDRTVAMADRPVIVVAIAARSLLDPGNYSKSVLDALEGTLFLTDASVAGVACLGERSRLSQDAVVGAAQLPAGATLQEVSVALESLASHTSRLL